MLLSEELETLGADVINVLGVRSIAAQAITRKVKQLAQRARRLEAERLALAGAVTVLDDATAANVVSLDHARRQQRVTDLAGVSNDTDR